MISFNGVNSIMIEKFEFDFIQELNPECGSDGSIKQFMPQSRYENHNNSRLNAHGKGPFCKFTIGSKGVGCRGVYALFSGEELLYIGLCDDLNRRFNMGYGNISLKNCFVGGQSTNCKINSLVLSRYLYGKKVMMYFYETDNHEQVERTLIQVLNPPYNGFGVYSTVPSQTQKNLSIANKNERMPLITPNVSIDNKNLNKNWNKIINKFNNTKIELHTTPKSSARVPLWFTVYATNSELYIDNAKNNRPSSKISYPRRLSFDEFTRMYPIHLKRETGKAVSAEALAASHNQVYWYAIMKNCGL